MFFLNIFYKNIPIIIKFISIPFCIIFAIIILKFIAYFFSKNQSFKQEKFLYFIDIFLVFVIIVKYLFFIKTCNCITCLPNIVLLTYLFLNLNLRKKSISNLSTSYKKIKNLETYTETLSTKNDELSAFQHDFNNIVQTIGGLLAIEKYDNLKRYYKGLKIDCQTINDMDLLDSSKIKNPEIFTLLTNKYKLAKQNGIRMNLEINSDLSKIKSDIFQIIRILGILLDNAIEASKECDEKILNVLFDIEGNYYHITIENSFIDTNLSTSALFKKGFSTKPGNKGLGLWKVNKIIEQNNNLSLQTYKDSNCFVQKLNIKT